MEFSGSLFVIDSDTVGREEMSAALEALGWKVHAFSGLSDYLKISNSQATGCVVLMNSVGSEAHQQLQEHKRHGHSLQPVIYVPETFDVAKTIEVFKDFTFLLQSSVDCEKPSDRVLEPKSLVRNTLPPSIDLIPTDEALATTSTIERRIVALASGGRSNKQMTQALGLPLRSLQRLKAGLYHRLQIDSPADLVRVNERLGQLPLPPK